MNSFNLSEWAVRHRILVLFFMLLCLAAGVMSYTRLGREEDPEFAVQTMIVQTVWPGATTADTMLQVTDAIEKKLQETPNLDYVKSYTKPGVSVVYVNLLQSMDPADIPWTWYEVRKKVADIKYTLPPGIQGPYFNDEFGDVFGIIYGLTYDGFSLRETRDFAEIAKAAFQRAPDVDKVEIFGDQQEKIYLSFSPAKLAALGLNFNEVLTAVAEQNAVVPAGVINTENEDILVQVSGALVDAASVSKIDLFINNRFYRLADIATIEDGYVDPPTKMFRVNGKPAIGIGVSMRSGGNNLEFGKGLDAVARQLKQQFPVGIDVNLVSNQPDVVKEAIGGFTKALGEAVAIVLVVSFLSLGIRAGLVVALSIPLVLSIVFIGMEYMQISLQRISLGALIIALGLLVDDAMITVEMMVSKIEEGFEKIKAATFAYTSTAFPMLTGTLVTIFGFWPIGFAESNTGQYCFSLFAVIAIALISSWFVAVVFSPVIGVTVLPAHVPKHGADTGPGPFMRAFHGVLTFCMRFRYVTIIATIGLFVLSIYGQNFVQRQFFPSSDRPELVVTMDLSTNSSIFATQAKVDEVEKLLEGDEDVDHYSAYIGGGAIRFYLPLDVQLDNDFIAQLVVVAKDLDARDRLKVKLDRAFEQGFDDVTVRVSRLELGPPVGWPVQYRVSGNTPEEARRLAEDVANALRQSGVTKLVNFDWNEKSKTLRLVINQDKARQVGLSSQSLSQSLNMILDGQVVTQIRDSIYLIDLTARATDAERGSLDALRNLQVSLPNGQSVPLNEIATLDYTLDEGYLWRRDRLPTITVQADMPDGFEAPTVYSRLRPAIQEIVKTLPAGARVVEGGTVEKSAQSNAALIAQLPIMIALMLIVLMIQLQSFQRLFLVISVAPLGLIGVVVAMLTTSTPMGFVATLGIIALAGMIIRNSVILIDQIEHNRNAGIHPWHAVTEAALHRFRPILLTASAAILGMIPIMGDVFWGPMAYAVVGGLAGATLLTLLFLPALYLAWFRIQEPGDVNQREAPIGIDNALEV
ncbi:efflux RND transporter permease subunit [Mesorhizobium sp. ZC-5]|uniref:efflux RND transporter permease subunit n=1 Tax=Mesorhizobium sp. ZC-5 TaxID=2986066 RepID=UPI0021E8E2DB|nr:efflux RND transporter permease subunit [Mesorhizobium sp. ZC-5]MCV3243887.1 efflux RND transporter permease subunit [Mesorhizobium sp. ZC-5]